MDGTHLLFLISSVRSSCVILSFPFLRFKRRASVHGSSLAIGTLASPVLCEDDHKRKVHTRLYSLGIFGTKMATKISGQLGSALLTAEKLWRFRPLQLRSP